MARLYARVNSDAKGTTTTKRGHETISGEVLWGDKENPKNALGFMVTWPKYHNTPTITVRMGTNPEQKIRL